MPSIMVIVVTCDATTAAAAGVERRIYIMYGVTKTAICSVSTSIYCIARCFDKRVRNSGVYYYT